MPRRKTDRIWEQKVFALKAQEPQLSAEAIARRFEEQQGGMGHWPAARTIRRILDEEWPKVTPEERGQYAYFRWPESMEDGSLPWEASSAGLELLRVMLSEVRPAIRLVRWFWRVTQVAPSASVVIRLTCAAQLAVEEALGMTQQRRAVEWFLAFQPWRSAEDSWAYGRALQGPSREPIPPFSKMSIMVPVEAGESQGVDVERAFDIIHPGLGKAMVWQLKMGDYENLTVKQWALRLEELGEDADVERIFNVIDPGLGSAMVEFRRVLTTTDLSGIENLTTRELMKIKEQAEGAGNGEGKRE